MPTSKAILVLCCTFLAASASPSVIDHHLAGVDDVRLLVSLGSRLDPPRGSNPDEFVAVLRDTCRARLGSGDVELSEDSARTLLVSVAFEKGSWTPTQSSIAVSIRVEIRETLRELTSPQEVVASTWQMGDLLLVPEVDVQSEILDSVSFLIDEFCGRVTQAKAYSAGSGDG